MHHNIGSNAPHYMGYCAIVKGLTVGGLDFLKYPWELFLKDIFLLILWNEELEPSMDSLESNDSIDEISGIYVMSLEIIL